MMSEYTMDNLGTRFTLQTYFKVLWSNTCKSDLMFDVYYRKHEKAVKVRANRIFICVNNIHNPIVNPELITLPIQRNWVLYMQYAIFCQKITLKSSTVVYFFIN